MNEIVPELPPLRFDDHKVIRIAASRVTLDTIVAAFDRGESPEQIAQNYPALSLSDVYRAIGYYLEHKSQLDEHLSATAKLTSDIRQEVESRHNPTGIRARLLARKSARS
jgi:uncharacterized protein (DUF433 family)